MGASDNSSGQGPRRPEFWIGEGDSVVRRCPDARETQSRQKRKNLKRRPNCPPRTEGSRTTLERVFSAVGKTPLRAPGRRGCGQKGRGRRGGGSWQSQASRSLTQTLQNGGKLILKLTLQSWCKPSESRTWASAGAGLASAWADVPPRGCGFATRQVTQGIGVMPPAPHPPPALSCPHLPLEEGFSPSSPLS